MRIIIIYLLLITSYLYSQEVKFVFKNDKVAFDGFLVPEAKFNGYKNTSEELKVEKQKSLEKDKLIENYKKENEILLNLNKEANIKISLMNLKMQAQLDLSNFYKERADFSFKLEIKLSAYKLTTYIFLGISIAELLGFGCFMLAYYLKDKI